LRIGAKEDLDDESRLNIAEREERIASKEAKSRAVVLEMIGDLPDAEATAPENVLFVCKLNPVTDDEDLELIFSRFDPAAKAEIIRDPDTGESLNYAFVEFTNKEQCTEAYFKMNNALVDDRRIRVDFSQSVSKIWNKYTQRARQKSRNSTLEQREKLVFNERPEQFHRPSKTLRVNEESFDKHTGNDNSNYRGKTYFENKRVKATKYDVENRLQNFDQDKCVRIVRERSREIDNSPCSRSSSRSRSRSPSSRRKQKYRNDREHKKSDGNHSRRHKYRHRDRHSRESHKARSRERHRGRNDHDRSERKREGSKDRSKQCRK